MGSQHDLCLRTSGTAQLYGCVFHGETHVTMAIFAYNTSNILRNGEEKSRIQIEAKPISATEN